MYMVNSKLYMQWQHMHDNVNVTIHSNCYHKCNVTIQGNVTMHCN